MLNEKESIDMNNRIRELKRELKEYLEKTSVTVEEKAALEKWVADGHSVHENEMMAVYEGNRPLDFLEVHRDLEKIRKETERMNPKEAKKYADAYFGWEEETEEPLTIEKLKEMVNEMTFKICAYESVITKFHLQEHAKQALCDIQESGLPFLL